MLHYLNLLSLVLTLVSLHKKVREIYVELFNYLPTSVSTYLSI